MPATYPGGVWSPTTKNTNDVIQASHINDGQNETVAIENQLLTVNNWTPALKFAGLSVGMTYSAQTGTYIQAGKLTFAYFSFTLTSKGSSTGAATITGLPVSATAFPPGQLDFAGGGASLGVPYMVIITNTLTLLQMSGGSRVTLTDANFTGTDTLRGVVIFTV